MILPGDLYLCLNEINTDFRSKIINAGFSESIFENQDIDKHEFCIVDAESENFEADNYKSAYILCISSTPENVRKIVDKNPCARVLAFKNETACLYFLYDFVSFFVFGMFKDSDLAEIYGLFQSARDNIKIIDCIDFEQLNDLPKGISVCSINAISENASLSEMSAMEHKLVDAFSPDSIISFTMPQDVISYKKLLFVDTQSQ